MEVIDQVAFDSWVLSHPVHAWARFLTAHASLLTSFLTSHNPSLFKMGQLVYNLVEWFSNRSRGCNIVKHMRLVSRCIDYYYHSFQPMRDTCITESSKGLWAHAWLRVYTNVALILSCRFIQYNPTSLERNHKHELQTEVDLGVPIDLILPETYTGTDSGGESRNEYCWVP